MYFQIEKWGKFEGSHDIEQFTQQSVVAAGTLVHQLCANITTDE